MEANVQQIAYNKLKALLKRSESARRDWFADGRIEDWKNACLKEFHYLFDRPEHYSTDFEAALSGLRSIVLKARSPGLTEKDFHDAMELARSVIRKAINDFEEHYPHLCQP